MKATLRLFLTLAILIIPAQAGASTILYGVVTGDGNAFPFGGGSDPNPATTYQQVYDGSLFGGPVFITAITFFGHSGDFSTNTYNLSLSTSNNPVNGLDTSTFANNIGSDNALFDSQALSGAIPATFTFSGGFFYDPSNGDLLITIVTNAANTGGFTGFAEAMNGSFGTLSSRAHDYGTQFSSWGLVTEFTYDSSAVPEPASLLLLGTGLAALAVRLRRRKTA